MVDSLRIVDGRTSVRVYSKKSNARYGTVCAILPIIMAEDMYDDNEYEDQNSNNNRGGKARGFAAMDPKKQRKIASLGGKAAHAKGTAHEFTPEEAKRAGKKGGEK